ncbi:hypothetical protein C8R44DRAFT_868455 [Mycena epipterygia]|nr:hypothetical protein C8R44DRAFT_868455 [Mycena epipterygia]
MLCASCKHRLPPSDALPNSTQTEELQTLLRAWYFPLNTAHYQSQFATSTAALAQYDSEIERLEETLQAMLADRMKLQHYAQGCRSAVSSIRQLPSEILCEIFMAYSSSSPEPHSSAGEKKHISTLMTRDGQSPPVAFYPVLELLAEHSPRWQFVTLRLDVAALTAIRNVQERLGSLEKLSLTLWDPDSVANNTGTTIFRSAPRLTHVRINIPDPHSCPQLPWKQLRSFTFDDGDVNTMVSIQNLSGAFEFRGGLYYIGVPFDLPPITSAISSFLLEVGGDPNPHNTMQVFGDILGCLTLPHLRELYFVRPEDSYSSHTVFWLVSQFKALSLRSSFRETLRVLEISHITITADDLVRSLASLGSLERLVISDQAAVMRTPAHILVTDTLLLRLTSTPDTSDSTLVPKLNHIVCTSFCNFTPQIYFDFIASRITPGRLPFQAVLRRLGTSPFEFPPEVHQKLWDLVKRRELRFLLEQADVSTLPP